MLSTDDIQSIWPDDKHYQRVVVLAQELAGLSNFRKCGGCTDHANMEIPTKDCCVYDIAYAILKRLDESN